MSFARISPTPSTASSSASLAASSSSRPPNSATICATTSLRQPRDAPEHAIPAGRDRVVERVELAVVAEQLGEPAEVEQVLVGEAADLLQRGGERLVGVAGRGSRARAPTSPRPRRPSSPRAASRSGVPRCRARRCSARSRPPSASRAPSAAAPSARRAAWCRPRTPAPSAASRPGPGACGTCPASRVPGWPSRAPRGCPRGCTWRRRRTRETTSRRWEIGDHERVGLLGDALGGPVAGARLVERIVGSGISWTFAIVILVAFAFRMIAPSIFASW